MEQIHWATNRHGDWSTTRVFVFDHCELEEMKGATLERIGQIKSMFQVAVRGLWVGGRWNFRARCPAAQAEIGSDFVGLPEWPRDHVVSYLCFCHPDGDAPKAGASKPGAISDDDTTAQIIRGFMAGACPNWWKLEPIATDAAWQAAADEIKRHDRKRAGSSCWYSLRSKPVWPPVSRRPRRNRG